MDSTPGAGTTAETRIRQQEVVAELGRQALETDDLDRLLRDASAAVSEALEADYAAVLERLPDGDGAVLRAGVGWPDGLVGAATVPVDEDTQAGHALRTDGAVVVDDLGADERFEGAGLFADHDVVSGVGAVVGTDEDPWGVLGAYTTDRREFTEYDAAFVRSVAAVLASAIEARETRRQLEDIYGRISDAFFALDEDWRFTYLNEQAHEVINPDDRELEGKYVWDEFPAATERKFKPKYERAMYEQETVSFEEYYPEPLDAWFEVRAYPSETGLSVYFRDVTERKSRDRRLRESEQRYRTLAECFPNGIVTLFDDDLEYTLAAGRAFDYLPVDPDDVEDRTPREVWGDDVADELETALRAALDGEERSVELAYDDREWLVHAVPVTDDAGEVFAGMTMAQDITERKQYQAELERALDLLEKTERIADVAGWEVDPETEEPYWSDHLFDILDVDYDDQPTLEQALDVYHSEADRETVEEAVEEALESGEPFDVEARFPRPSGDVGWLRVQGQPEVEDGEVVTLRGAVQDVTERKEHEQALQERRNELRALIDVLPVAVFVGEADGEIVEWNEAAEEIWGGEVAESESVAEYDRYEAWWADTGDPVEPEEWPLARALEGEEVTDPDEIRIKGFDGECRTVLNHGMPVRDADGEVTRAVVTLVDITERKEYQRRLEESNERLEQFAYAASHDLQEPLRMVSSYLRMIENRYADDLDEDGREFLEFAVDGADRMRAMVRGLLNYSRVETKGDPLEAVDLEDVLEDVIEDLQVRIEETRAEITADDLPRVRGDESQLRQVLQNLLENAIEYHDEGPTRVHVGAERDGDEWVISVADEGIGIDPDDRERIFEVFERLHTAEEHEGVGIGLALCQRIVERHGGDIWVESEPGEGATFSFTLPADD